MSVKHTLVLSGLSAFLLAWGQAHAQIVPIGIENSSFTVDAILEGPNGTLTDDLEASSYGEDVLVTHDYAVANPDDFDPAQVLPQDGAITNFANGAIFQLQPYDGPNVVVVSGDAPLTLAAAAQASYSEISFLVSNLSFFRSSPLSFTLNYTNGNSVDISSTGNVPNWQSGIAPTDGQVAASFVADLYLGFPSVETIQLDEYDFDLDPSAGILGSITVHGGSNKLDVFAVSGIDPVSTPEPGTWALLAAGAAGLLFASRRAKLCA